MKIMSHHHKLVLPTPAQIEWLESGIGVIIHLDVQVFEPGYEFRNQWGYTPDPSVFTPTELDTDQWIATAKAAGATYAVLVAKHCSGFSLWPTEAHGYSVKSSPWRDGKGDIVADFFASCNFRRARPPDPPFRGAGAPRTTKWRELDSQTPIFQHPAMETPASSFKLRANAPEGRKQFPIRKTIRVILHENQKQFPIRLQTYFSTDDVVFAENILGVPGKPVTMPVWTQGGLNAWHYQVLDNQVTELGARMTTVIAKNKQHEDYAGPVTGTHIYRNNRAAGAAARFSIQVPDRCLGYLIEGNQGLAEIKPGKAGDGLGLVLTNTDLNGKPVPSQPATGANGMNR